MSAPEDAATFWDAHYGQKDQIWSGRPNGVLVGEASDLAPGTALDLGSGEGADAIWLAGRGWHVTAVEVSQTAIDRGTRQAETQGVAALIDWQRHDLAETFPNGAYDLVNVQYLHSPIEFPRDRVLRAAADAVAPGGILLIVGHAGPPPWAKDPHPEHLFPSATDTASSAGLDGPGWELLIREERERDTIDPNGEPARISDTIVKARRR